MGLRIESDVFHVVRYDFFRTAVSTVNGYVMSRLTIVLWKVWGFFTPFIMYLFLSCSLDILNLLYLPC